MDERALGLIELPAILERLATAAASQPGAELAGVLRPSSEAPEVERRQARTSEAIDLIDSAAEPNLSALGEIRDEAALAQRGGVLDAAALRRIANTARCGVTARRELESAENVPLLVTVAAQIDPDLGSLADAIDLAVEQDGTDLRDTASPALRKLRRALRDGRVQLADHLRRLARDPNLREHLSEDFVTERAGRPVLALKASARAAVPGIVHDSSGSGQTLFVEPFAVVEDSNRLREAESAEREEVSRILRLLSERVGDAAESLDALVEAGAEIDLALACGTLSRRWRGALVTDQSQGRSPRGEAPAARRGLALCRSTSSSVSCAQSSSPARTPAARRWR